uniref:Uncharacterized protein n=1 Tax=Arundo donax TaxID=35708 RepID=A0A0A9F0X8_ARUDO
MPMSAALIVSSIAPSLPDIIEMAAATGSRLSNGSWVMGSGALNRSPSPPRSYSDTKDGCAIFPRWEAAISGVSAMSGMAA